MKVVVVDYGMGNLRSVAKALERVSQESGIKTEIVVSNQSQTLQDADRVVVPGQGAIHDCMHELNASGLADGVRRAAQSKPFLGICVGMQMLFEHSEEGDTPGLGLLPGNVRRFAPNLRSAEGALLKVPHMGWNEVLPQTAHPLWDGINPAGERFYFVHSYWCEPRDTSAIAAQSDYGHRFTCAVAQANIAAVQFHPEKSAAAGLRLLANFLRWNP